MARAENGCDQLLVTRRSCVDEMCCAFEEAENVGKEVDRPVPPRLIDMTSYQQEFSSLQSRITDPAREQLLVLDAHLRIKGASKSFYTEFQIEPGETVGKKLSELSNGQWNIPALLQLLNDLPKVDGELENFEMEDDFPALGRKTMLLSARRLPGEEAPSGTILLFIRDTGGQKRIEAEVGELLTRFHALCSIGDAVIITDPESRITFMNPTAENVTGRGVLDALQKQVTDVFNIMSEQSPQTVDGPVARAIRDGVPIGFTNPTVLIAADGRERPIDGNAAPIVDAEGTLRGVVLVFHDVSYQRRAEHEWELSEFRYRRLFDSAEDGIMILDAITAKVLDVNPFMADLLDYPRVHFLGQELWELGVFEDAEMSKKAMATLQRLGRIRYEDLPLQHKDGRHIPVEFVGNVYPEGRRNAIQCNIRDITLRRRHANQLAEARQEAEMANRSKSEFLVNMSHEIRTPMTAILGFAEMLLLKSPEECAQAGCVQIIHRNGLHLMEVINEILDLSKMEAGQMKVGQVSCDLPELLAEIIALMRPRAAEKGLGFGMTFQGPIPRLIQTDPLRLRQILVNLLGNAVKFTESGRIDLLITDEGSGGPHILLRVDVIDTGVGMPSNQLARLFQPFTQGDESSTREFGGTGLGLTISRRFARLLGGDVTVVSLPGIGSTFTLKIDAGPAIEVEPLQGLTETTFAALAAPKVHAEIHLSGRILLVEDGADNQRLFQMQIGDAGYTVASAVNGQIAVELATAQKFDLILMDMQMPIMDGYTATIELRSRGLTIPIIALTAHAMAEDRDKCIASGCSGYLAKPVDEETLLKTIAEYLGNDQAPAPRENAHQGVIAGPPPHAEANILETIKSSNAGD